MRKIKYPVVLAAVVLGLAAIVYGMTADMISYVENLETGNVDIRLEHFTVNEEGAEVPADDRITLNRDISYIPRITNTGRECYVRVSAVLMEPGGKSSLMGPEQIYGLGENWNRKGNFFYLTKPLAPGEQVDLFKGISLPSGWRELGGSSFRVSVKAEAIQSSNFEPDFDSVLPWGAVMSHGGGEDSGGWAVSLKDTSVFDYTEESGFECPSGDLFGSSGALMPGDRMMKEIEIRNSSGGDLIVYMNAVSTGQKISDKIQAKILSDGKTVYEGSLQELCRSPEMKLEKISRGDRILLEIILDFPEDSGNMYEQVRENVAWEFKAVKTDGRNVQTGDDSGTAAALITALVSVMLIAAVLRRKEKE